MTNRMTNRKLRASTFLRSAPRLLTFAAASVWLCAAACSIGDDDDPSAESDFLACDLDDECAPARANATCGAEGYCVDPLGMRIEVPRESGGSGGASGTSGGSGGRSGSGGSGSGGSSGAGGQSGASGTGTGGTGGAGGMGGTVDGGTYEPCAGKTCGDSCSLCEPGDGDCVETGEVKVCDRDGTCTGSPVECSSVALPDCGEDGEGDACSHSGAEPIPECCEGSQHLRCSDEACTDSIPGSCFGTLQEVPGSDACGGGYQPCEGKECGDSCDVCDPSDPTCLISDAVQSCDRNGVCIFGSADCSEPVMCDPGSDTCGTGEACCAIGRCGPVGTNQSVCEPADPETGDCMVCACEKEPGGCPRCNSPDTQIATPDGERSIAELREGDLVLSMHGGELIAVPILATRQMMVTDHAVVHLALDNGRYVEVSGSHPTAAGQRLDALQPGDHIGDLQVVSVELIPYAHDRTYDILPASDSGTYLAAGALLASTLHR